MFRRSRSYLGSLVAIAWSPDARPTIPDYKNPDFGVALDALENVTLIRSKSNLIGVEELCEEVFAILRLTEITSSEPTVVDILAQRVSSFSVGRSSNVEWQHAWNMA